MSEIITMDDVAASFDIMKQCLIDHWTRILELGPIDNSILITKLKSFPNYIEGRPENSCFLCEYFNESVQGCKRCNSLVNWVDVKYLPNSKKSTFCTADGSIYYNISESTDNPVLFRKNVKILLDRFKLL